MQPDVVVHTCPSTREAEAEELRFQGQPGLQGKFKAGLDYTVRAVSKNRNKQTNENYQYVKKQEN